MKVIKTSLFILSLLLLVQSVYAIGVSIGPAKMTLYQDVKTNEFTLVENSVEVSNPNSYPVTIRMQASDMIKLSDKEFTLQPGISRNINFTVVMKKEDYYGDITAVFSAEGHLSFPATCPVTVYARNLTAGKNSNSPTKPNLLSPANGGSFNADKVTLSWSPSSDADNNVIIYYYDIDDNSDLSSPEYSGWTLNTGKTLDIEKNKTYYWRIKVSDSVNTKNSDTWSFRSMNTVPGKPALLSPVNGSTLDYKPTLDWSDVTDSDGDTVYYDVVVDDNSDFSSAVILERLTDSQYDTNSDDLVSNTYYWKVRSSDGTGESDFSDAWNFMLDIPYCGDGTCGNNETTCSCPQDCGASCGDGCCTLGETCYSCISDCGDCSPDGGGDNNGNGGDGGGYTYTPPEQDEEPDLAELQENLTNVNDEISLIKQSINEAEKYLIELPDTQALLSQIEDLQNSASSMSNATELENLINQLISLKEDLDGVVPDINITDQISLVYNSLKENEINDIQSEFMVKPLNINVTRVVKLIEIDKSGDTTYQTYFEIVTGAGFSNETIIEKIPKSIAGNIDDIVFSSEPIVINADPIVEFNNSFSYVVDGNKMDAISDYGRPVVYKESIVSGITGMVVQYGAILGIIVIAAGIVIYFIFVRKKESYSGYRYKP